MDLFCNDRYWNDVEDTTQKILPSMRPEPRVQLRHAAESGRHGNVNYTRQWGKHDYTFKFIAQGGASGAEAADGLGGGQAYQPKNNILKSLFQASILLAEAEEPGDSGFKVPIKCTWYRYRGSEPELIQDINSNVY